MYESFTAFRPHFNALARGGYFKMVLLKENNWKNSLHYYYRIVVWFLVVFYNFQHIVRVIQVRHCTDRLVGTLFILLTTLNSFGKQVYFNLRSRRIDNVINIIIGELFAPTNTYHEELMRNNALILARLLKICQTGGFICGVLFISYPMVDKALGNEVYLTGYMPFDTTGSPAFELAGAYMGISITMQAYGHITMDCTIGAFYAFAKTQLQILRYNLENLTGNFEVNKRLFKYLDDDIVIKQILHKKTVNCVKHHELIVWYAKEIESIFNEAMTIHFFVVAWVVCMTVYKIGGLAIFSAEFLTMGVYLSCMLAQLFVYCYFGTHVNFESDLINESIYRSGWLSLSPGFRRSLLILMQRSKRTIEPHIAHIIPLSMDTFIRVLRSSYALFTILDTK